MSKATKWIDRIVRVVLGLVFVVAGSGKFSPDGNLATQFADWGYVYAVLLAVGIVETGGGVLLIVGQAVLPAVVGLTVVMVGAVVTHFRFLDTIGFPFLPLAMLAGIGTIVYIRTRPEWRRHSDPKEF